MIEQSTFTILSTSAALTAIVSTNIFPLVLPTDPTLPALTYQKIAALPLSETLTPAETVVRTRMQIDSWGTTYGAAAALRNTLVKTLTATTGVVGSENIQRILQLNQSDYFDSDALQYQCRAEFYIFHSSQE